MDNKELPQYVKDAINKIQKAEKLALNLSERGFYVAFSGGKDSQCIYHLCELAGVKFFAEMSATSIDPPDVIRFVRNQYPGVKIVPPKISIYDLAIKKKCLPTMLKRFCCAEFKETGGIGYCVMTGVRKSESVKRSKREILELSSHKGQYSFSQLKEVESLCIGGKDKVLFNPIIDWTEPQVWYFLNNVLHVKHCELYDKGKHRVGCLFCPMEPIREKIKDIQEYPHLTQKWIQTIDKIKAINKNKGNLWTQLTTPEIFEWWINGKRLSEFIFEKENKLFNDDRFFI